MIKTKHLQFSYLPNNQIKYIFFIIHLIRLKCLELLYVDALYTEQRRFATKNRSPIEFAPELDQLIEASPNFPSEQVE